MRKCNYIAAFFLALAIFVNNDNYLTVIQVTGWGKMVVDYSADNSLSVALKRTFSGEEPCGFCRVVTNVKNDEGENSSSNEKKESSKVLAEKKQISQEAIVVNRKGAGSLLKEDSVSFYSHILSTPTPPPKLASSC